MAFQKKNLTLTNSFSELLALDQIELQILANRNVRYSTFYYFNSKRQVMVEQFQLFHKETLSTNTCPESE